MESQLSFEQLLEKLKQDRIDLAQSDSFDEISVIWKRIKETYAKCQEQLELTNQKLAKLDTLKDDTPIENLNLDFSKALSRIEELSKLVKTESIDTLPSLIEEMQMLKKFCFEKLDQEKVKMEEI